MMNIAKRMIIAVSATAMLMTMPIVFPDKVFAADVCDIDTAITYQKIQGFGGINLPEWTGSDLTDAQCQTAFGNGEDELGLSILRVYVNNDPSQWYKALPVAKKAVAQGAVVFATPWNPPDELCETFTRTKTNWDVSVTVQEEQKRLRHDKYAEYAQHLNDFVHYIRDNGVELYSISVQNEPDYGEEWTWWTSDECLDFIINYGDQIDCRLMSPETFQYNKEYYNKILENLEAFANIDLFGTHFYGTTRSNMDFPALESCGKDIWMTEVYVPNSDQDSADRFPEALQVSENIHNGLVVGNISAYTWWYIRRHYGLMKEDGNISKRGYCMAQYSKFVRPGDIRISATEQPAEDVYISAYQGDDNQIVIVAVNESSTSYAQNFSLSNEEEITDIDRYRTSADENLALTENLEYDGSSFWAQLPAESVSTFIITVDGDIVPTEPDTQPDTDNKGYYFHDTFEGNTDSWNGRGSATVTLSGRTSYAGKESLLVQDRTSAWNGAGKSLDTKTFIPGNAYSFSANIMYFDGDATDKFYLKLQYTDAEGTTHYTSIAEATAVKGEWTQLANTDFVIPDGASDMVLYVETVESINNFYIDEAIGATGGTIINGAESNSFIIGDINNDGIINVFDLVLAKKGLLYGFDSNTTSLAADVNQDGSVMVTDIILLQKWLFGKIKSFTE